MTECSNIVRKKFWQRIPLWQQILPGLFFGVLAGALMGENASEHQSNVLVLICEVKSKSHTVKSLASYNAAAADLGAVWMIAAMAIFAIEDGFVKVASETLPVGQILIIFGLGGAAVFACLACINKEPLFVRDVVSLPMRIRVVFEITGRLFYVLAISMIPLSAATVILQATPLVVIAGAALVFGEKVGWRRWAAVLLGLVGVVVIVQPDIEVSF